METFVSTADAAKQIGTTERYLRLLIRRNPELRPKRTFGGSFLWTAEDVEAVKSRNRKLGRPAKLIDGG